MAIYPTPPRDLRYRFKPWRLPLSQVRHINRLAGRLAAAPLYAGLDVRLKLTGRQSSTRVENLLLDTTGGQ